MWSVIASLGFLCDHRAALGFDLPKDLVKAFAGNRSRTRKLL